MVGLDKERMKILDKAMDKMYKLGYKHGIADSKSKAFERASSRKQSKFKRIV